MLDTSVRTEGDAPATRAAFVALWRAANVPLLGSVATSADARMRLQRLRLDDAVMAAKETFATAFEEWVEEDDARMDRYACVMTAGRWGRPRTTASRAVAAGRQCNQTQTTSRGAFIQAHRTPPVSAR